LKIEARRPFMRGMGDKRIQKDSTIVKQIKWISESGTES
jgi:hypothetical protein